MQNNRRVYFPLWLAVLALIVACHRDEAKQPIRDPATSASDSTTTHPSFTSMGVQLPQTADRYALLVGLRRYPGGVNELPGAQTALDTMRTVLVERYGFPKPNVLVLSEEAATRTAVIDAFRTHLGKASSTGTALFYFVGHGLQMDQNYSVLDLERNDQDQALYVWGKNGRGSIILDDEIGFLARQLRTKRLVLIVDGCFSGTMAQEPLFTVGNLVRPRPRPKFLRMSLTFNQAAASLDVPSQFVSDGSAPSPSGGALSDMEGAVLLSATSDNSEAFAGVDWPTWGEAHSVFTHYLNKRLSAVAATTTFEQVVAATRGDIDTEVCNVYGKCQEPEVLGPAKSTRVVHLLGPRKP
jgi:hypothetical protein